MDAFLRRIEDRDGPDLIRLLGGVFAEYPGCVLDVDAEEPWLRAPASALERGWVVEHEGHARGCIALTTREDGVVMLRKCYLDARLRGRGWGRRLVQQVLDAAREAGACRVELWTDTRFTTAHRVYERLGFTFTGGERALDDLSDTDELHYALDLD